MMLKKICNFEIGIWFAFVWALLSFFIGTMNPTETQLSIHRIEGAIISGLAKSGHVKEEEEDKFFVGEITYDSLFNRYLDGGK